LARADQLASWDDASSAAPSEDARWVADPPTTDVSALALQT